MTSLTLLVLANNSLSSPVPSELGSMARLTRLDLDDTLFVGWLPCELGLLPNLSGLHVGNNSLGGWVPSELGMANMTYLFLAKNTFSGAIPNEWMTMPHLEHLNLRNNAFSGMIPEFRHLTSLLMLDIRGNPGLRGTIPEALSYLEEDKSCVFGWMKSSCFLRFDCSDTLCGYDCPCSNASSGIGVLNESVFSNANETAERRTLVQSKR
jgi:Leucine rich repeat